MLSRIDKMYQTLRKGVKSGNLDLAKIGEIAQLILESVNLDCAFAVSNVDYKYQLDSIIACTKEGLSEPINKHIYLNKSHYDEMVAEYTANPFSESPIDALSGSPIKSLLHEAVMYQGEFYGSVGFGSLTEREWSDEDREMLDILTMTVLFYLSFSHLATGANRDKRINEIATAEGVAGSFRIDFETGECHTIVSQPFSEGILDEWSHYNTMVTTLEQKYVDPIYGKRLLETFDMDNVKQTLSPDNPSISMDIPIISNGKAAWMRCEVKATSFDSSGAPIQAVAFSKDVTEEVRNSALLASSFSTESQKYMVIAGIHLDTEKYAVYSDNRPQEARQGEAEEYGDLGAIMDYMAYSVVDPEYSDRLLEITSLDKMKEKFDSGVHRLEFDFPCTMPDKTYWTRLEMVPAQTYRAGNRQVVMYYSDITEIKEQEFQLEEAKRDLRMEREHLAEKEHQLTIDPLTGAYNRIGFEKYMKALEDSDEPLGFMMIDVDNFKEINDTYGHEAGDITLTKVVNNIKHAFRDDDKIFRIGGDEFAMVLNGCKESAWDSIQAKLSSIHDNLKTTSKFRIPVTLSAGLVISEDGFTEKIPKLADEAMYITKRNGRAGLTQTDVNGGEVNSWRDGESVAIDPSSPFDIGKWRYEAPLDGSSAPKLFLDEPARFILGFPNALSPEECYEAWASALPERHTSMLADIQDKTAAVGQAEATHTITHPTLGEIRVRTRVKYSENNGMREFSGHFVALGDESSLPTYDDNQFIIEAMNHVCFSTYYIALSTRRYIVIKGLDDAIETQDNDFQNTVNSFIELFVHPDFRADGYDFVNMDTLQDRLKGQNFIEYEYKSLSANGWCRSRWLPVKWDEGGNVTHVLLTSESIEEAKQAALAQAKRAEDIAKMQLRIGNMISKRSVIQTGVIDKETGQLRIWLDALFSGNGMASDFESSKKYGASIIHPDDRERFEQEYSLRRISEIVDRTGHCDMTFRVVGPDGGVREAVHHYETLDTDPTKLLMAIEG